MTDLDANVSHSVCSIRCFAQNTLSSLGGCFRYSDVHNSDNPVRLVYVVKSGNLQSPPAGGKRSAHLGYIRYALRWLAV